MFDDLDHGGGVEALQPTIPVDQRARSDQDRLL
jgi:hypothetical protein